MMFVTVTATPVITRLLAFRHLIFTQLLQTLFRAVAFIGRSRLQHLVNHRVIAIKTFGLEIWAFVPFRVQPVHTIHDGFNGFRRGTLKIGVFNTQHELTAVVTCESENKEQYARRRRADNLSG